jgi:orotate phosphoribosyltransferase
LAERIADDLLATGAVVLRPDEPFTWSSGLKSPIYCDNRITISHPEVRERIAEGFTAEIRARFPETALIAGAATGGIPHAAWASQKLNLPMIYVRDKPKGHGKQNMIEGVLAPGQKTVVIEDLVSTGGSSLKVAEAVREAGGDVLAVLAVFTYKLPKAEQMFAAAGIPLVTLTDYDVLIGRALAGGRIGNDQLELLRTWRQNPEAFGK